MPPQTTSSLLPPRGQVIIEGDYNAFIFLKESPLERAQTKQSLVYRVSLD